jgi:pyrroloquinoline quinone (PQQ) biosynthesis protein C
MRLCPHGAHRAKEFFWHLYKEEQGGFQPGRDHATVFKTFCNSIGIGDAALEAEYEGYWPNFTHMLDARPCQEALVRELATAYAWESAILRIAGPLGQILNEVAARYALERKTLAYFDEHIEVDEEHARLALDVLLTYATTNGLIDEAFDAIFDTLVKRNPWVLPLVSPEGTEAEKR